MMLGARRRLQSLESLIGQVEVMGYGEECLDKLRARVFVGYFVERI
jgi:hypothetical protein